VLADPQVAVPALPADRGGTTPAVVLTALAQEKDRERTLAAGFQKYLAKPGDSEALVACVAEVAG
jgi:CheY-like chemotaxis protein